MLRGNTPSPPTSLFFLFLSISFPSLFKKKSENFGGGGGLNPLNPPPLKYALDFVRYLDFCVTALKTFLCKFQRKADGVLAIMPIEQRVLAV